MLHSGNGPDSAIDEWAAEAARRGYILIAPEYTTAGEPAEYHYTPSEHAAAQLALRDARKTVLNRQRPGLRRRPA